MKTIIEATNKDFTAVVDVKQVKDAEGIPVWSDEENRIGKCQNAVRVFTFYEPIHEGEDATFTKVTISAGDILILADFIRKQEQVITEEFIDSEF